MCYFKLQLKHPLSRDLHILYCGTCYLFSSFSSSVLTQERVDASILTYLIIHDLRLDSAFIYLSDTLIHSSSTAN